jgi:uncharacterized membrane protein SpoIIM required for sporulation
LYRWVIQVLRRKRAREWESQSNTTRAVLISLVVVLMFLAALLEASTWAAVYLKVGAIPDLETALYFSTVTFTTLGYGDITLDASWRLLSAFQAANGTIMFGWTTAIVMAAIQRMVVRREAASA